MSLEHKIIRKLSAKRKTLAVAESCTGGLLANRLTDVPGSSKCFKFGLVVYSNTAKIKFLKVTPLTIKKHGAVSEPTALAMATGVRRQLKSDFGLSITGIAGPTGGSLRKPVGLTYIAVATVKKTSCLKYQFRGSRQRVKSQAATQALKLLLKQIV
ncbi:MAG TPA: CinA family protein [Candidatus Omnitrophota bacterium]|nr:CinA family protein [Candidatus Omnitrophota bacterium]